MNLFEGCLRNGTGQIEEHRLRGVILLDFSRIPNEYGLAYIETIDYNRISHSSIQLKDLEPPSILYSQLIEGEVLDLVGPNGGILSSDEEVKLVSDLPVLDGPGV